MNQYLANAFIDEMEKIAKDRSILDLPKKAQKGFIATNRKDLEENTRRSNKYYAEIGPKGRGAWALATGGTMAALLKKSPTLRRGMGTGPLLGGTSAGLGHYLAMDGMAKKHKKTKTRKGKK
tara:strand:- start:1149 stop:1514 length:366 start_codon:yes stop_codon:yes gene_type:complete